MSDTGNNAIRKVVIATGAVSTLAGVKSGQSGYQDGPGASAMFNAPNGLRLLNNITLLVADKNNNVVRAIDLTTQIVSTFAGTGIAGSKNGSPLDAQFIEPISIGVDKDGVVFVGEGSGADDIRKISK